MRLLFITFAPFSIDSGHTARLTFTLNHIAENADVFVLNLRKGDITEDIKFLYPKIEFISDGAQFEGWTVINASDISKRISTFTQENKIDLVILQMEVWDIIRELAFALEGVTKFAVVFHGTPFLAAPLSPSGNFEQDVQEFLKKDLEQYKYDYISQHYKEVSEVFPLIHVIANNNTVGNSLHTYFPKVKVWKMEQTIVVPNLLMQSKKIQKVYDFAYLARMEKGKGIEYLSSILKHASIKLGRKVTLALMGKCDDSFSKTEMERLLAESKTSKHYEVINFGVVDQKAKAEALSKSKLFLYPSIYDNYPTVVNEALLFCLPVVMWDTNIYRSNYQGCDGIKSAKLFNTKDFAQKAVELLIDFDRSSHAISVFLSKFPSSGEIAQSDSKLYQDIIKTQS